MEDRLGLRAPDDVAPPPRRRGCRASTSSRPGRERAVEVLAPAGGEVVEHGHLVAALEQGVDEVRADEAGAAGDEGAHEARHLSRGPSPAPPGPLLPSPRCAACSSPSRESTARARPPRRGCCCEALGDEAVGVREPGGTARRRAGARAAQGSRRSSSAREAEALLFAAARAELVRAGDPAGARAGQRRGLRPLPRLLARLPGRGARPGGGGGRAHQRASPPAGCEPDLTLLLELDPDARGRARGGETTASRSEGAALQRAVARAYERAGRAPTRRAGAGSTPTARPRRCTPTCSRRWQARAGAGAPA